MPFTENYAIDIRLFGAVELNSEYGCVIEAPDEKPNLFLLLKYLLLEPQREANYEEVLRLVWADNEPKSGAARVRLKRLRIMLSPLIPEGGPELITYKAGKYGIHPGYLLHFDTDTVILLLKQIEDIPLHDKKGLALGKEVLELMRGPLMEYTKEVVWLAEYRRFYQREFVRLTHDTLKRMRAVEDTELIKLVCSRALILAPADEALQREILTFLADYRMDKELAEYVHSLMLTGQAEWLSSNKDTPKEKPVACNENITEDNTIYIRLFGDVELQNKYGHLIENRSRTPLLLLKYLLLNHPQAVTIDEILKLWPISKAGVNPESTVAVRLRRAREALRPLHLDKKKGLIQYQNRVFWLNQDYTVKRDIDELEDILGCLSTYGLEDPEGLKRSTEALELFRGPLLEYTGSAPWLEEYRSHYKDKFCRLATDALNRVKVLKANEALSLLMQRAVTVAPECKELHEQIIQYLQEQKYEIELIHHLSQLSRSGKVNWMENPS